MPRHQPCPPPPSPCDEWWWSCGPLLSVKRAFPFRLPQLPGVVGAATPPSPSSPPPLTESSLPPPPAAPPPLPPASLTSPPPLWLERLSGVVCCQRSLRLELGAPGVSPPASGKSRVPAPGGLKRQLGENWKFLNGDWNGDCSCPPISPGCRDLLKRETGVISEPPALAPAPAPPPPAAAELSPQAARRPGDFTGVASFMSDHMASALMRKVC